jgi:hypothetical protein
MMFQVLARMFLLGRSRPGRVALKPDTVSARAVKCDQICERNR